MRYVLTHNSHLTTHTWKSLRPLSWLINSQKYKQQYSKAPKWRPSIAKKGQRNASDGCQTQHHANIDYEVEDEYTEDYYEDWFDDTAKCAFCGHYYCTCCGCDCWMDDFDDEEED